MAPAGRRGGEVLQAAGIDPQLLGKPYARVTSHAYSRLWLDLARRMDDEFFGMDARRLKSGSFAFMSRCAIHEQTLEPALTGILRFLCLQFDDFQPPRGGLAEIVLDEAPGRYGRALSYFTLWMITHGLACWLVGRRIPILAIDLRCPQPDYIEDYRVMFSDNLRFSRPLSRLLFNADCLARQSAATSGSCGASRLARRPTSWSAIAIRRAWRRGSRPAQPAAGTLAGRGRARRAFLHGASTLRRKLSLEGQSYQALKDQVRRDLAIARLDAGAANFAELALELGFADGSAFHKAFKWTGSTPGSTGRRSRRKPRRPNRQASCPKRSAVDRANAAQRHLRYVANGSGTGSQSGLSKPLRQIEAFRHCPAPATA